MNENYATFSFNKPDNFNNFNNFNKIVEDIRKYSNPSIPTDKQIDRQDFISFYSTGTVPRLLSNDYKKLYTPYGYGLDISFKSDDINRKDLKITPKTLNNKFLTLFICIVVIIFNL